MIKKLELEFIFDEQVDDDYTRLELKDIRTGPGTTLTEEERQTVAEIWAQSDSYWADSYWADTCSEILNVIDVPR